MHSFHPSRGRILFEVVCAFGIVTSSIGAWRQTGASALLIAAVIAALWGFVRLFDVLRAQPVQVNQPQRIDFAADGQADLSTVAEVVDPPAPVVVRAVAPIKVEDPAHVEPVEQPVGLAPSQGTPAPKPSKARKTTKAPKKPKAVAPVEEPSIPEPSFAEKVEAEQVVEFPHVEEDHHARIEPLFEPDPFARLPRRAFGRRGQI